VSEVFKRFEFREINCTFWCKRIYPRFKIKEFRENSWFRTDSADQRQIKIENKEVNDIV
jgi:hypothetical protein